MIESWILARSTPGMTPAGVVTKETEHRSLMTQERNGSEFMDRHAGEGRDKVFSFPALWVVAG